MQTIRRHKVKALALTLFFTIISISLIFLLTRTEQDPFHAQAVVNPAFTSLTYGVQAFLWWDDGGSAGIHMDWVRMMSFTHVKQTFAWQDVEPRPDEWFFGNGDRIMNELEQRGLQVVVRLSDSPDWVHPNQPPGDYVDAPPDPDYLDDWADFCGTVAARYQGRVAAYQIWNEPNLAREWGGRPPDAVEYVTLLRRCSQAIRAADPDAILISAGLAPTGRHDDVAHRDDMYLQAMYNAGFQHEIDVVGVHAPGYSAPDYGPDDAERAGRGRWASFRRVEDLRKIMIANGDAARQMAILEVGYTTDPRPDSPYHWFAVDEVTQARLLVEAYEYAARHWRPWVGLMSAIYIPRRTWTPEDEQYWWSITDPEMAVIRPAFDALVHMTKYCGDIIVPTPTFEEAGSVNEPNPCH